MQLSGKIDKSELKASSPVKFENNLDNMSTRAVQLSNKERLILRKQALKMKKRPVLAVGNSISSFDCQYNSLLVSLLYFISTISLHVRLDLNDGRL